MDKKDKEQKKKENIAQDDILVDPTERAAKCAREIDAVLLKHRCLLDVALIISSHGIIPRTTVIPITDKGDLSMEVFPDDPTRVN